MFGPSQKSQRYIPPVSNTASTPDFINAYLLDTYRPYKDRHVQSLARIINEKEKVRGKAVCIMENISEPQFKKLESAWGLDDDDFWKCHSSGFPKELAQKWQPPHIYGENMYLGSRKRDFTWYPGDVKNRETQLSGPRKWDYIEGTFEYYGLGHISENELKMSADSFASPNPVTRGCFYTDWNDQHILCSNTRISYYRVNERLYLFLVDAPLNLQLQYQSKPRHVRPTLRFHYAMNWGGLSMPLLLKYEDRPGGSCYNISRSLLHIFKYRWQRDVLFKHKGDATSQAFPGPPLAYVMASSLSRNNFDYLNKEIRDISFRQLRSPKLATNERLHDLREDLANLISIPVAEATANVQDSIRNFWDEEEENFHQLAQGGLGDSPLCGLEKTKAKAEELEKFLLDSFQIQMNSVSVREARRVTQLTYFALIFLPTTVVSGIFGMNVREFNGSMLSIWVWGATSLAVTLLTLFVFSVLAKPQIFSWIWRTERGRIPVE